MHSIWRPAATGPSTPTPPIWAETLYIDDPAGVILRAEQADHLRAALATLPIEARTVVVLHDGEGWSTREIAQVCAIGVATTQKRLQRARFRLAQALAGPLGRVADSDPSCATTRAAVGNYIDQALTEPERREVEDHLRCCPHCPPIAQALLGLKDALRTSGPQDPLAADLTRIIDRIRDDR